MMATAQRHPDLLFKATVFGAFILFGVLAMIDDLLLILR
jgi:hypothetical protein